MTNATNSPAVNDTMEDRAMVMPTASPVLRPVPSLGLAGGPQSPESILNYNKRHKPYCVILCVNKLTVLLAELFTYLGL